MGKILSCCCGGDDDTNDDERSDDPRSRLLNGTSRGRTGRDYGTHPNANSSQTGGGGKPSDQQQADDEQAILSRILQQTANNVIDVSAADAHAVEPHEFIERARKYDQKLKTSSASGGAQNLPRKSNKCLLADSTSQQVDRSLSSPVLNAQEASSFKQHCQDVGRAVDDIHVEHKEDLVVQFAP